MGKNFVNKIHNIELCSLVIYIFWFCCILLRYQVLGWRPGEFRGSSPSLEANSGIYQTGHDHFRILSSLLAVTELGHFTNVGGVNRKYWYLFLCYLTAMSVYKGERVCHRLSLCSKDAGVENYCIENCLVKQHSTMGCADKFLALPGRKQATATKLGIYSTYTPRSSIHFLACCSNLCKPLKKTIGRIVRRTRSPRQRWPPRRTKNGDLSIVLSVQGTGGSLTGPDPENRVGDQDAGSPGRPSVRVIHVLYRVPRLESPERCHNFNLTDKTVIWYN